MLNLSNKPTRIVHHSCVIHYKLNDKFHRIDGPAVIFPDGRQIWYQNGKCHRESGPAVIRPDGSQEWYKNGKLHRLDGPAKIYSDGSKSWYENGKFIKHIKEIN